MKSLLIGLLALGTLSAYADTTCPLVVSKKISTHLIPVLESKGYTVRFSEPTDYDVYLSLAHTSSAGDVSECQGGNVSCWARAEAELKVERHRVIDGVKIKYAVFEISKSDMYLNNNSNEKDAKKKDKLIEKVYNEFIKKAPKCDSL